MTHTRREAIAIGASGIATALAGCQALTSSDDSMMDLMLANYTPDQLSIAVRVIDPEKTEWSEAVEHRLPQSDDALFFDMPPASEGEDSDVTSKIFEDIAEPKRYTVEVRVRYDSVVQHDTVADKMEHFHYIPTSTESLFIGIYPIGQNDVAIEFILP